MAGLLASEQGGMDEATAKKLGEAFSEGLRMLYEKELIVKIGQIAASGQPLPAVIAKTVLPMIMSFKEQRQATPANLVSFAAMIITVIANDLKETGVITEDKKVIEDSLQAIIGLYLKTDKQAGEAVAQSGIADQATEQDVQRMSQLMGA